MDHRPCSILVVHDGHRGLGRHRDGERVAPRALLDDPAGELHDAGRLDPRPDDGRIAKATEIEPVLALVEGAELLAEDLRDAVDRERSLQREIRDHVAGDVRTVDTDAAGKEKPLHFEPTGCFQQRVRSEGIGLGSRLRVLLARAGEDGPQVVDRLRPGSLDDLDKSAGIRQIDPDEIQPVGDVLKALEVAAAVQDVDLGFVSRQELADDLRPDEARTARDEDRHGSSVSDATIVPSGPRPRPCLASEGLAALARISHRVALRDPGPTRYGRGRPASLVCRLTGMPPPGSARPTGSAPE